MWTSSVVSGVGAYAVLSGAVSGTATAVIIGGIVGMVVVLTAIGIVLTTRRMRRCMDGVNDGIAALGRGELDRARDLFWHWSEQAPIARASAVARHNLGWTLMRRGELQEAIAIATNNEECHADALKAVALFPTSAVDLALYHALAGHLEEAQAWFAKAEQRSNESCAPGFPAMKAYVRALIECRKGNCVEASRLLDERWGECETSLTGEVVRPIRVVRAFAHAATGPRNAGVAETLIASARPIAFAGEYDFLAVAWPEMAAFLAAHQLTRVAA
jgi:hypothetical protein